MTARIPDTVLAHRERMAADDRRRLDAARSLQSAEETITGNVTAFREGTRALAEEGGYPIILPSGTFVADARCAWLVEALDAHIVNAWKPRIRKGWFSASALGKTDEELIAEYRGEAQEAPPAKLLRVFSVGNDRDRTYKRWLKEAGRSVVGGARDRKVKIPHLRLQGECDDVLRGPSGFVVFEMKTMNSYSFGKLEEPLPQHVMQVHAYMAGLSIRDGAIISYENKNTSDLRLFWVDWDADLWEAIAARLRRLRAIAERPAESADNAIPAAAESDERRKPTTIT